MDTITYRVYVGFCGYVGASEEVEIEAPIGATEEEILSLVQDDADVAYLLEVDEDEIVDLGDGEWEVTINFAGYMGIDETYTVYADTIDEAVDAALEEAKWDLTVEDFEPDED